MIPRFTEFYIPVLQVLSNIEKKDINLIIDETAVLVGISDSDKAITTRSGNRFRYRSNISWAVTDLTQGGFIERSGRGIYVITIEGLELLENHPECLDREFLASKSEKFKNFLNRQGTRSKESPEANIAENESSYSELADEKSSIGYPQDSSESPDLKEANDTVTIEELQHTLSILKKANLSTTEIEDRINQLQSDAIITRYCSKLISLMNDLCTDMGNSESIHIDFNPGQNIKISIGSSNKTVDIKNLDSFNQSISEECHDKSGKVLCDISDYQNQESESYVHATTNAAIKDCIPTPQIWFEPHTDRTFLVCGDTDSFIDLFKSYGGYQSSDWKGIKGWIFLNGKRNGIERDLKEFLINNSVNQNGELSNKTTFQPSGIDSKKTASKTRDKGFSKWATRMQNLKTFNFLGVTGPHKAILLLAVLHLIKYKNIVESKIYFTQELETQYNNYWKQLIGGSPTLGVAYPYAHLGNEDFVVVKKKRPFQDFNVTWNRQKINSHISHLIINPQLFGLLKDKSYNHLFVDILINYSIPKSMPNQNTKDKLSNTPDLDRNKFRRFLQTSPNKSGNSLTSSSIGVYIGALCSEYIMQVVEAFDPSGDIFRVTDIVTLNKILCKIDEDIRTDRTTPGYRSAVKHYIRYISSMVDGPSKI